MKSFESVKLKFCGDSDLYGKFIVIAFALGETHFLSVFNLNHS